MKFLLITKIGLERYYLVSQGKNKREVIDSAVNLHNNVRKVLSKGKIGTRIDQDGYKYQIVTHQMRSLGHFNWFGQTAIIMNDGAVNVPKGVYEK